MVSEWKSGGEEDGINSQPCQNSEGSIQPVSHFVIQNLEPPAHDTQPLRALESLPRDDAGPSDYQGIDSAIPLRDASPEEQLHKYRPLDPSKNQIRLLRLPPSDGTPARERSVHEDIETTLLSVELEEAPDYEALSYRWAKDNDTTGITIRGLVHKISYTLKRALQEWQSPTETKLVWVDAICIDQKNNAERSAQVAKMRTIYSNASLVVVWLGLVSSSSPLAFSFVRDLYEHLNEPSYFQETLSNPREAPRLEALLHLLRREYWYRIWVIQEVNSARSLVLKCGSDTMEWEHLVKVQKELCNARYFFNKSLYVGGPIVLGLPNSVSSSTEPRGLCEALRFFNLQSASDPRDMLYAIIGLTDAGEDPRMPIDYSQPVREVYIKIVEYLVNRDAKLDIICAGVRTENKHRLPSWTPDWSGGVRHWSSFKSSSLTNRPPLAPSLKASKGLLAKASIITGEKDVLRTRGFRVDAVSTLGDAWKMEDGGIYTGMKRAIILWYKLSQVDETGGRDQAFVRTIASDLRSGGVWPRKVVSRVLGVFARHALETLPSELIDRRLQTFAESERNSDALVNRWLQTISSSVYGRRFFLSDQGCMGLCPEDYEDGDFIAILLGCSYPVLLRPHDGYHELIGDVYLDGYMYGKGIDELDEGKRKLETFDIR